MPVTPFHFGLGAISGGYGKKVFSFRAFCFSNVIIDLEALYRIPLGLYPYHHWLHTYLVGVIVCLALIVPVGIPFCLWVSRWWNRNRKGSVVERIYIPETMPLTGAFVGATLGALTHVFCDSIMHGDIQPLLPFDDGNDMHGWITTSQLHGILIGGFAIGSVLYCVRHRLWRKA